MSRTQALHENVHRQSRTVEWPVHEGRKNNLYPSEVFGQMVFDLKELSMQLPKPMYASFLKQTSGHGQTLDKPTADAIAHAVRVWAMNKGATHYTHWFQPQTDTTAEKHDSFLDFKYTCTPTGNQTTAIDAFSGKSLLQAEPDASSFPNGGTRSTFEARGYTIWDTTSPMFLRYGPNNTKILYIPSIFISYNGEALDEKTVLLRSVEGINRESVRMLHLLGHNDVTRVTATLGTEQEFFLVDRALYALRPDLRMAGRALVGSLPPKHQQMEDHYFGRIPSRALAVMNEAELECYKLGVPIKTRHNEVAPAQFEMAPIFEDATVAVDHNLLTMDVLHQVAHKHKMKVLFHEKPFKGVNGSGKHCNWALSTDTGINLLNPSDTPETNYPFLIFLTATLLAVHRHAGLLRATIASAANEHRLGANEAPPAIISAFLGEQLDEVLNAIEEGRPVSQSQKPHVAAVKVGGASLDMKVSTLPEIARDLTDRNRTSPFAFTGNKFEFRAVGSKQSPSFPVTVLNAAVASTLQEITGKLEKAKGSKKAPDSTEILKIVKEIIIETKSVRFEGDGYSSEWHAEAAKRGLLNIKGSPEAFKQLLQPVNVDMLTKDQGIMSKAELESRYHVLVEKYGKDLLIEASTLRSMLFTQILPQVLEFRKQLAESCVALKGVGASIVPESGLLRQIEGPVTEMMADGQTLVDLIDTAKDLDHEPLAVKLNKDLLPLMEKIRKNADVLEQLTPDKSWPFPKYTELLFT